MRVTPKQRVNKVINLFHKGFVFTCIGVTLWGTSVLGYRFVRYMTVTRPEFMKQKELAERSLLAEGSSENLKDIALDISQ